MRTWMLGGLAMLGLAMTACSDGGGNGSSGGGGTAPTTFKIQPGPEASDRAAIAFFDAREGDTIEFAEGTYDLPTGLIVTGKRGIKVKGAGKDKTFLDFTNSDSSEGINVNHVDGITIEGLTVQNTPGNAIRVFRSNFVTMRDVRALWTDYDTCSTDPGADNSCANNGAYGLYPVECRHVLIEDSESFGASDAGIYVGQTSDVIVRRTRAEYNVAGFEFENTYRAVFEDNIATNNTGGFLVFDLPGLNQYGEKNVIRRNKSFNNNTPNFAPVGNIVGLTPRGTGMLILATDQLEVYENEIYDHDTVGIAIVNFGLADPAQPDQKYDFYPEGLHFHHNTFRNNGGNTQEPDLNRGEGSLFPLLLRLKNVARPAHIVWDGAVDRPNGCDEVPVDQDGVPLTEPNSSERAADRYEARSDERGRPNFQRSDPEPSCKYNAWKFDDNGAPKLPENGLCIEDNNIFENTTPQTVLATEFLNAHLTSSDPAQLVQDLLVPASNDVTPHRCTLPARPAPTLKLPFRPSTAGAEARPSAAEVSRVCNGGAPGQVNFEALLNYNCPLLSQYRLFVNPQDPRSKPNGGGVPFDLQSVLFSDYASKYRFLFMPAGKSAKYKDHNDGVTATFDFPVGTVFAKTFAFKDGDQENVVETRLLIKRQTARDVSWVGLAYIWKGTGAQRVAELAIEGGTAGVNWDYDDPDPEAQNPDGEHAHYTGSTDRYAIPSALSCITCHGGDDREPGAAPLGLKPRNLNREYDYPNGTRMNQLQYLAQRGLLTGLPADLTQIERLPRWNVPGDSGELPDSDADIHQRARAFLEVNCMHCHNPGGAASNSGLFLDYYRAVNTQYGICKKPVAAGKGTGENRRYDIVPGNADASILPFRLASVEAGVKMPPVARSVAQGEAAALIIRWINEVLPTADTENEEVCSGALGGLPLPIPGLPGLSPDALPLGELPLADVPLSELTQLNQLPATLPLPSVDGVLGPGVPGITELLGVPVPVP